ncbi:MAG: hypothetical protein EOM25_02695 [Deltaproteobacteria bacterium]|nr:hypothetical protein [Deltaproteobacteria bacterium]
MTIKSTLQPAPLPFFGLGAALTGSVLTGAARMKLRPCPRQDRLHDRLWFPEIPPTFLAGYDRLVRLGREIRGR